MTGLILHNAEHTELWPACLLDANGTLPEPAVPDRWALRDKPSGQFIALYDPPAGWTATDRYSQAQAPQEAIQDAMRTPPQTATASSDACIDMQGLVARLAALDLDAGAYADRTGLPLVAEPCTLAFAGFDRYGRSLWLTAATAQAWERLRLAAQAEGIELEAISGFRSHWYQLGIFRRKLERGQTVAEILTVNAAPGFSEHHSGTALDISTPGEPAAEESFETTAAFAWLVAHAAEHGFAMSYPRDNPHGIIYEPWHWRLQSATATSPQPSGTDPRAHRAA